MTDKHAVALGRKGGKARATLPAAELSRIGRLGGQPRKYRLSPAGELERRDSDHWVTLGRPYTRAARAALYRLRAAP
jgi:hypothetical protein